jgi:hypothetical protein
MSADWLQERPGAVTIAVKVQPRAGRNAVGKAEGHELQVRVAAPPVDDAANEALLRFLARSLDCPRAALRLLRGQHSRHKLVEVRGLTGPAVRARLRATG